MIMTVTRETLLHSIKIHEEQIKRAEAMIEYYTKKLELLNEYESHPIEERTLRVYIDETTKTIDLMDKFEELTDDGFRKYERIISRSTQYIEVYSYLRVTISFVITHCSRCKKVGDITMTNFKKRENGYSTLIEYTRTQLRKKKNKLALIEMKPGEKPIILFEAPFLLRAQNSSNREGYGNEYNGYELVKEGTLYGETTDYCIIGVEIQNKFQYK